ncbi:MAG TPA: hypothetical protein VNL16_01265 [Chloroflexota bacterium]|nr:hypothetical protein [Chloroflexota bacterium]
MQGAGGNGVPDHVVAIAAGEATSAALESDGSVWVWGYLPAQNGDQPYPEQIAGFSSVTTIGVGWEDVVALKSDGTVWSWGRNDDGELERVMN